MRISVLFKIMSVLSVIAIIAYLYSLRGSAKIEVATPDQCMTCHSDYGSIDASHPTEIFGCASCHGGNAFANDKEIAHQAIVKNPSRLEHADKYCASCHADIISRVKMSLMESQHGIQEVLKEQWGHKSVGLDPVRGEELAQNHFEKACASCHINQDEEIFNPKYAKGGGCADCHRVGQKEVSKTHPAFSTQISSDNCLKCHNRSNRIGLSYFGKFESEGYGTPYHDGNFTNRLDDQRFYYELPADVHHQSAGLDCIDCHTEVGVMGDGKAHKNMEEAVDIACTDCHKPIFKELLPNSLAQTLLDLNKNVPNAPKKIAFSAKKNTPIYNLQSDDNNLTLYRKRDGKDFNISMMSDNAYHTSAIHERLDCSACHAQWIPSCYGCHEVYFEEGKQFNWTTKQMSDGAWLELRSFLRFETPSLGVGYNEKIMPFAPGCQIIGSIFEDKKVEQFHAMAMAGWEPHTTGKARECVDCHFSPASLGLGRGNFDLKDGKILFEPFYDSIKSGMPFSYPIDGFVSKEGKQFQTTSREKARSFNSDELHTIVNAYECILCHRSYDDPIYKDFALSKEQFSKGLTPCLK